MGSRLLTLLFLGILMHTTKAQLLSNCSFEGTPQDARMPASWFMCSDGTTPDILPGPWGVNTRPSDANTYLGLITRPDGSWESIGQRFTSPLVPNQCYIISVDLARSLAYVGYTNPIKFRIWLSKEKCTRDFLLTETKAIEHVYWRTYEFMFKPKIDFEYIILEAWFANPNIKSGGNVLIDYLEPPVKCPGV